MIIGITGTPGTGKSTVSAHIDGKVVDLKEYLEENNLGEANQRGEIEVGLDELRDNPPVEPEEEDLILEGHLAHFMNLDYCVVLRCRPDILRERLEGRDYSSEKVEENIESEKLDIILSQAVERHEKVFEVDTTDKEVIEVINKVKQAISEEKKDYGDVDWSKFL